MQQLSDSPTLILHGGKIYTVDDREPWAEAVAIAGDTIVAVGADDEILPLAGSDTRRINLAGRLALPGLCDAHIHFYHWSVGRRQVQLAGTRSKAEMLERIAERVKETPPGQWIVGQGWNESLWGETEFPTRADLDPITGPDRPALFSRSDMHGAVANSAALYLAGIDASTPNPPGGIIDRDAEGKPTGVLRELAIALVGRHIPSVDGQQLDQTFQDGIRALHELGITAIHDQRVKEGTDGPRVLRGLQRLHRQGRLQLRVSCNIAAKDLACVDSVGLQTGLGDNFLRIGHIKVFSDGSLGSRTAWMLQPFRKLTPNEPDNFGVNVTPVEQMARQFRQATELGFPISVHAIGDRAIRVCLDIFEELADGGLQPPIPHRIEHVQTLDPADLSRLAQLQITASMQPIHCTDDMDTADLLLGDRAKYTYTFRSLWDSGALLAFGSDAPVSDPNPFLGIHAALFRQRPDRMEQPAWYPQERLTLEQVLYGYTMGAARAAGWESVIGSISPGKRADMIVLDRDLFDLVEKGVASTEIASTRVDLTVFDGQLVFERQ